jgi:two-component system cell cycle sensor histidine kinase/response regulator CckA
VKESGGSISLNWQRGEGTTFKVYLPRAKGEIVERAAPARVPDESIRGSEIIFLVEDQSELRNHTHKFLQKLGYKLLVAGLPKEAIQIAQQSTGTIDLLLADVVMPGMNGRALAQQLRRITLTCWFSMCPGTLTRLLSRPFSIRTMLSWRSRFFSES